MCQAASYIYKKLVNDGILNQAFAIAPVRSLTEVKNSVPRGAGSVSAPSNVTLIRTSLQAFHAAHLHFEFIAV